MSPWSAALWLVTRTGSRCHIYFPLSKKDFSSKWFVSVYQAVKVQIWESLSIYLTYIRKHSSIYKSDMSQLSAPRTVVTYSNRGLQQDYPKIVLPLRNYTICGNPTPDTGFLIHSRDLKTALVPRNWTLITMPAKFHEVPPHGGCTVILRQEFGAT